MVDNKDKSNDLEKQKNGEEKESSSKPNSTGSPSNQNSTLSSVSNQHNPEMIGKYQIIRKIGSGGMSIVYEARQNDPKRLVALKVIRGGGFLDKHHKKLFEREVQALARLSHPGIASIYETGCTPDGQNFYTMELVRGEILKDYLERTGKDGTLPPDKLGERLAIFRKISDAVTYAHQRGVIHRDLKPSNIIVQREYEPSDTISEPSSPGIKILDFGLARITEADIAVATFGTEVGMIMGTLPYMSPEQIRGNPDEIDVRSDVYSLGVILYEMIADQKPYDVNQAMIHEAARIICETPPAPISKSWRGTKKLSRDLEIIVLKALEKSTTRRYQSVSELRGDVARFLTGQPINARPPSTAYQLQKLIKRHKIGFGFACTIAVLIAVFVVGMSIQAEKVVRERDRADREAKLSKQVSDFMVSLFSAPDPFQGKGKEVTVREMLNEGSARVAAELKDQPELQTKVMLAMTNSYYGLGILDKASELAQTAISIGKSKLEQDNEIVSDGLNMLGAIQMEQGDFIGAEKAFEESLELRRQLYGSNSTQVAEDISNLAVLNSLRGNLKKAEEGYRESLAIYRKVLGNDSKEVATLLNNLGLELQYQGKLTEALPLCRESLEIKRRIYGSNHPLIASSLTNLGMLYERVKNYSEAEKLLQEALAMDRKVLGESHREVGRILSCLGTLYLDWNRLTEAEKYYRQSMAIDMQLFGEDNPEMDRHFQNLGIVFTKEKRLAEAEESLRKALSLKLLRFDSYHWEVATTKSMLGECLAVQKKYDEAELLLVESFSIIKNQFGTQHIRTRRAGERLVTLYEARGMKTKASSIRAELGMSE